MELVVGCMIVMGALDVVGFNDGVGVGAGDSVGDADGIVSVGWKLGAGDGAGLADGVRVGSVGRGVVGMLVGLNVVGTRVGVVVGFMVVGATVGVDVVGTGLGTMVGLVVTGMGAALGAVVGDAVVTGERDGAAVVWSMTVPPSGLGVGTAVGLAVGLSVIWFSAADPLVFPSGGWVLRRVGKAVGPAVGVVGSDVGNWVGKNVIICRPRSSSPSAAFCRERVTPRTFLSLAVAAVASVKKKKKKKRMAATKGAPVGLIVPSAKKRARPKM